MNYLKKLRLTFLQIVVLLLSFTILSQAVYSASKQTIRIASPKGLYGGILFIADLKNYFKDHGLNVEVIFASSGIAASEMLMDERADFVMLTEIAAVNSILSGKNLAILTSIAEFDNTEIIARKDRKIIKPTDLRDKKIGIVSGSAAEYFLLSFLAQYSLTFGDLELVNIPAGKQVTALKSGKIDAVATWSPHTHRAYEALGGNGLRWQIQGMQKKFWLMAGLHGHLPQAETLRRLLEGLIEAEKFILSNESDAKNLLGDFLQIPENEILSDWANTTLQVALPRELLNTMEFETKWLMVQRNSNRNSIPNYLENFSFAPLEKVKPEAINIIH